MKKLIYVLMFIFLIGCYADEPEPLDMSNDCTKYYDLCEDGGNDVYYICCSPYTYNCWWEVYGEEYYTVEYLWMMECEK